jgi:acyl carrier protein
MKRTCDIITSWLTELPTADRKGMIHANTDLINEGILDSMAILDLVAFLEDQFKVFFPIEEFVPENFRDVATIANLAERLAAKAA